MANQLCVLVVNYRSTKLLEQNLTEVEKAARAVDPTAAIVVVDNWSTTRERHAARKMAADNGWVLVEPDVNLGFGGGVNVGVSRSLELGASEVLVINPDAWIDETSLRRLHSAAAENRNTLLSPVVEDPEGGTWFAGNDLLLEDGTIQAASRRGQECEAGLQPWLSGACLWITREVWELSGGFDEEYFLYWEDIDFSHRVTAAGGTLKVLRDAVAVHDEGGTQRENPDRSRAKSELYYYYNIRNRMMFAVKHLGPEAIRRWRRFIPRTAWAVMLRGGRRQFLHSLVPTRGLLRGVWSAMRLARKSGSRAPAPHPPTPVQSPPDNAPQ